MAKALHIQGRRFGKLVAVEELPRVRGRRVWRLKCDCGGERVLPQASFCSGGVARSCGCDLQKLIRHGLSKTPEYKHWVNMISRCENPDATRFAHYGGRGIKICERWRENFKNFYDDMGSRPTPAHSVDRINVNGDYEPGNCRWATPREQSRNTRVNRLVSSDDRTVTLAEAAETAPVSYKTALRRIIRGWSPEDAVTLPPVKGRRP